MKIYFNSSSWYIGYRRDGYNHYVCPLPTLVIRWERKKKIFVASDLNSISTAYYVFKDNSILSPETLERFKEEFTKAYNSPYNYKWVSKDDKRNMW